MGVNNNDSQIIVNYNNTKIIKKNSIMTITMFIRAINDKVLLTRIIIKFIKFIIIINNDNNK